MEALVSLLDKKMHRRLHKICHFCIYMHTRVVYESVFGYVHAVALQECLLPRPNLGCSYSYNSSGF